MSDLGIGTTSQRGHRPHRPRRLRGCLAVLVALAVVVALGAFAYVKGVDTLKNWISGPADYSGQGHGSVIVQVKSGNTASDIAAQLLKQHVVKSEQAFTDAAKNDTRSRLIQVGYYRMRLQMSGQAALDLMLNPSSRVDTQVTIPEGWRASQIIAAIADHSNLSVSSLEAALKDTGGLGLPSYANGHAEGYLFPATYTLNPGSTATNVLHTMTAKFAQEATAVHLESGAAALHMSPGDIVKVASLIQAEASRSQDMPKVARVIYNRLHDHMMLQLDSTIHYALDSLGHVETTQQQRDSNSPYNSYKYYGLPPTPIDSPGQQALEAALHPAAGSWLYFVTVNLRTGETLFATTYAQHLQDNQQYIAYCQTSTAC